MHGNVQEWCQDNWHDNYDGAPTDGSAWLSSDESEVHVVRGGSWNYIPRLCRSAYRYFNLSTLLFNSTGFRVCCSALRAQVMTAKSATAKASVAFPSTRLEARIATGNSPTSST